LSVIESLLATQVIGRPQLGQNELWDEIDSTNNRALALARQGASEGIIVLAHSQTAGRGRLGRKWLSPAAAGIYMSVLLRPQDMTSLPLVTLASGLAVARAVEATTGIRLGLKWVNDLVVSGGKIGGILAELQTEITPDSDSLAQALIIGIGINISGDKVKLPSDLKGNIRWLEEIAHGPVNKNVLVSQIALELEQIIALLSAGQAVSVLNAWRGYSATLGESVRASIGETVIEGLALDITDSGALIIQTRGGMQEIHAGEVSIRRPDGSYC